MTIARKSTKPLFIIKSNPRFDQEILEELYTCILRIKKVHSTPYGHCPRCGLNSKVNSDFPYCMECNWDSLHDPSWNGNVGRCQD